MTLCRVLDGGVLILLDGVWYHSSERIHCGHCLCRRKDGKTLYYPSMLGTTIVRPGSNVVLPLMPEYIRNEDRNEKQDCEGNAAKRYFEEQGPGLARLKPTFLGDDVYACHGMCSRIRGLGMSYIFTCKDESPRWIAGPVAWGSLRAISGGNGTGGAILNTDTDGRTGAKGNAWRVEDTHFPHTVPPQGSTPIPGLPWCRPRGR
ncbi:MAG: hypothetical protein LBU25_09000 [Treponema sp.]|jgi:hypothetical protein|nr:hypothetical protein [Treponema sp.]